MSALRENVDRWLRFVRWQPGDVIELQALEVPDGRWTSNQFAHATTPDDAIRLIGEMEQRKPMGIYFLLNEVDPRVARRAKPNTWHPAPKKSGKDGASATTENDIKSRRAMLIDIDFDRPRGTSATDDEVEAASEVADRVYARLVEILGNDALGSGASGNGAAILVALDSLPDPQQDTKTISGVLTALNLLFGTPDGAKVDCSVIEAKRLCAAWGSTKHKGDDDPAYPHRQTSFTCADEVKPIGRDGLQKILDHLRADLTAEQRAVVDKAMGIKPAKTSTTVSEKTQSAESPFTPANACDPERVMAHLGIDTCPGCGSGGGGDTSFRAIDLDGKRGTKCMHDRCSGKGPAGFPGFRTNVDLVAEVKSITPIEAAFTICDWFNIEVQSRSNYRNASHYDHNNNHNASRRNHNQNDNDSSQDWPAPLDIPGGLLPVPPLTPEMLPEALRPWLLDIAERAQCPIEYVAVGAIVALGSVIGRRCGIRPKRHDDWTVIANLWGAAIGPPGVMKTPALNEARRPLERLAVRAQDQHKRDLAQFELAAMVAKAKREHLQSLVKQAVKEGKDPSADLAAQLNECEKPAPTERRYIVNDTTVEKLGELLNQNPNGLLHFRDELTGFLRGLDREGHEGDRAFYLSAWNGDSGHVYDRIGRGTVRVDAACVSLLGGIQPGPFSDYLLAAARGGAGDDGLVQRFQLLVYPDVATTWRNIDRWPDGNARNRVNAIFEKLDEAKPNGAERDGDGLRYLRFSSEAQEIFDTWRTALEHRLRDPDEAPIMAAHLSKYRKLMPALALIFHLTDTAWCDNVGGPVTPAAAELAIRWCAFLEAHARRVYQCVTERSKNAARLLAKKIQEGRLSSGFTARDVYRPEWSGLTDREDVSHALELLEDLHWLRSYPVQTGGREKTAYAINPAITPTITKAA